MQANTPLLSGSTSTTREGGSNPGRWRRAKATRMRRGRRPSPGKPRRPAAKEPTFPPPHATLWRRGRARFLRRSATPPLHEAEAGPVLPGQLPQRRDHGGHLQALLGHGSRFETGRAPLRRELRDGVRQDPKRLRCRTGGCAPPRRCWNLTASPLDERGVTAAQRSASNGLPRGPGCPRGALLRGAGHRQLTSERGPSAPRRAAAVSRHGYWGAAGTASRRTATAGASAERGPRLQGTRSAQRGREVPRFWGWLKARGDTPRPEGRRRGNFGAG